MRCFRFAYYADVTAELLRFRDVVPRGTPRSSRVRPRALPPVLTKYRILRINHVAGGSLPPAVVGEALQQQRAAAAATPGTRRVRRKATAITPCDIHADPVRRLPPRAHHPHATLMAFSDSHLDAAAAR